MFDTKKKSLLKGTQTKTTSTATNNAFIKGGLKKAARTTSLGNHAVKYTTTGNDFCDDFGKATNYKAPRTYTEVAATMATLWAQSKINAVKAAFYMRMVTRVTALPDGSKTSTTQRGQGLKHEGIFRMLWLAINHPMVFWSNIPLFISVGSWKDVITMLSYDLQYNGWEGRVLNWDQFAALIKAGLENPNSSNLVKKYLPQIKANSVCKTVEAQADNIIAKWICSKLFGGKETPATYKQYRKLKTSGTAHEWQKLISQKNMLAINFDTVHGRALAQLVSGKFLANNGLESAYGKWIESKPIAKYTGYVYELLGPVKIGYTNAKISKIQEMTINKQFLGLIETAKNGMDPSDTGLLVVVDTSSSMTSAVPGTKVSAYSVAKAMALYFSYLLKGTFESTWMEFNDTAELKQWKGSTPVEKLQLDRSEAYGSTEFQSVGRLFAKLLKSGVPEEDFPKGILCLSDGCFNPASVGERNQTNHKALLKTLKDAGFSKKYLDEFKTILWDVPNGYYGGSQTAFEDFADCPNLFHLSGLDPAAVAFVTGVKGPDGKVATTPKTTEELFEAAMNQEILNMITI